MTGEVETLEPDARCGTCAHLVDVETWMVPAHGGHVTFSAGHCELCGQIRGEYDDAGCREWRDAG